MKNFQCIILTTFFILIFCVACTPYRVLKKVKVPSGGIEYCVAKDDSTEFIRFKARADFRKKKKNQSREGIKAELNNLSRDMYKAVSRLIQKEYGNTSLTENQAFDCLAEAVDIYHYGKQANSNGTIDIEATITEKQIDRAISCYSKVPKARPPEPEEEEEIEIFPRAKVRTKKAIFAVMANRQDMVELCFQRQLRKGIRPKGKVVMSFTIGTRGTVSDVRVEKSTVRSPELVKCLKAVVVNTKFKAIAGHEDSMTITYPFRFN